MENKISIGKINGTDIFAVNSESGETFVPIKPICTALGIDDKAQRTKISEDDILGSVGVFSTSTGADGKQYEMFSLPLQYVFGWLFTINPKNVATEARKAVMNYRRQCYDALYSYFFSRSARQLESNQAELQELENLRQLMLQEKHIKSQINDTKSRIDKIRASRLDDLPSLFD